MQPGRIQLASEKYLQNPPHIPGLQHPDWPQAKPKPPRPPRPVLFWVKEALLFPLRLMGLFILIGLIPGTFLLWRLPSVADTHHADLTLLTLRAIDRDKSVRPFAPLGYRGTVKKHLLNFEPKDDTYYLHYSLSVLSANFYRLHLTDVTATRTAEGGYKYDLTFNHCPGHTVSGTTPHLDVPVEELAHARQAVAVLFPDPKQYAEVLDWGESLFWSEWLKSNSLFKVPKRFIPEPRGGTEEEKLWLAWQVLRGTGPNVEEELPHLEELFHQAFPDEVDRAAALQWAADLYDRMEGDFEGYQGTARAKYEKDLQQTHIEAWDGASDEEFIVALKRVLPPKTRWTYQWLLYRYVGLSEPSRTAAHKHWLSQFPGKARNRVLAFGKEIAELRRREGEPLPAVSQNLPLLCAVERLVGSDPYGRMCHEVIHREYGDGTAYGMLRMSIYFGYPNDEMYYLLAMRDPLDLHPTGSARATLHQKLDCLLGAALFPVIGGLGFITLIRWLLVPMLVHGSARTLWNKHMAGRGKEPILLWVCCVVFFASLGALLAPYTLPEYIAFQSASYLDLFLGAVGATLIGGVLIATCRRFLAVVLVLFRVDIEATWLDEFFGILAGGFILFHFGNNLSGIALFALADLTPAIIAHALRRNRADLADTAVIVVNA